MLTNDDNRWKEAEKVLRIAYRLNPRHKETKEELHAFFEYFGRNDLIEKFLKENLQLPMGLPLLTENEELVDMEEWVANEKKARWKLSGKSSTFLSFDWEGYYGYHSNSGDP